MRHTKLDDQLESLGYIRFPSITIEKAFCLYGKEDRKFYTLFNIDKGSIVYKGKKYRKPEDFINDVIQDNKNLYFDPDTYNPDYRKEFVDEKRIHETLLKCGLSENYCSYMNRGYRFGDNLGGKFAEVHGTDIILSETSWIPLMDENDPVDEKTCQMMKSTLGAIYATHIANLVEALNNMGKMNFIDSIEIKTFNKNTMSIVKKDGKQGIISKLEEVLKNLKRENNDE